MTDDEDEPWSKPADWWKGNGEPVEAEPELDEQAIHARMEPNGDLVLTIKKDTAPFFRDYLVQRVLARLGEATWTLLRRTQGTHAPTVETWRRLQGLKPE